MRRESGCPIPPELPRTVTLDACRGQRSMSEARWVNCTCLADAEKARLWQALKTCLEAIMISESRRRTGRRLQVSLVQKENIRANGYDLDYERFNPQVSSWISMH